MKKKMIQFFGVLTILAVTSMGFSFPCKAQSAHRQSLLALSKKNHTLAIIDPVTLKVMARVPVGPDPHEVIASADGKTAYVTNMGNGNSSEINVIDLVAQKVLPNIDTRPLYGPHGITFAAGKVWFTAQDSKAVGRYNPAEGKLDWCMGTGQDWTHMIYVTGDGKKVYATSAHSGTVSILENVLIQPGIGPMGKPFPGAKPHWDWKQAIIKVSKGSEGFDVSPDGREIWTAASDDGRISIIDTGTREVVATIDAKILGANRLKFTPDGKLALISGLRNGDLYIYDVASRKEIKRLNTGHGAAGILMQPDGSRAFIGCTADDYVAVIDLKKLEVTGHLDVGGKPDGLAWAVEQ